MEEKSNYDINKTLDRIYKQDNLLDILIEFEGVLDSLDIYAFQNWFDGEIVSGPHLKKYWVTVILKYPYEKMPDPDAGNRLLKHGAKVVYERATEEILWSEKAETADVYYRSQYSDEEEKKRKTRTVKFWYVHITMPRRFIEEFEKGVVDIGDDEEEEIVDLTTVQGADDEGLSDEENIRTEETDEDQVEESFKIDESLKRGDLEKLILNTISIDEYNSKIGNDKEVIVVGFFVEDENPAEDLSRFIQRSVEPILDSDVSPAPTETGYFVVFVEFERNKEFPESLLNLCKEIQNLNLEKEWFFKTYKHDEIEELNKRNIKNYVNLDSQDSFEMFECKKFFDNLTVDKLYLNENLVNFEKNNIVYSYKIVEKNIDPNAIVPSVNFNKLSENKKLDNVFGPDYHVTVADKGVFVYNIDTGKTFLLKG